MPTREEWNALLKNCYCVWTDSPQQGVYVFKAHQGQKSQGNAIAENFGDYSTEKDIYIFLPSDGYNRCYYWTSTLVDGVEDAHYSLGCTPS